jgi:ligand-binding sensor domain-containing protein
MRGPLSNIPEDGASTRPNNIGFGKMTFHALSKLWSSGQMDQLRTLLLFLVVLPITHLLGQTDRLEFDMLGTPDGMYNDFVTSVQEDSLGFIWLGSPVGIACYDGYEFRYYAMDKNDPHSLSHPNVWEVIRRSGNTLWVKTREGLNHFNLETRKSTRYYHHPADDCSLPGNYIYSCLLDIEENLWMGTDKGPALKLKGSQDFIRLAGSSHQGKAREVRGIVQTENGWVWLTANDTLYAFPDAKNDPRAFPLPATDQPLDNRVRALAVGPEKTLWLGTTDRGVYVFCLRELKFKQHFMPDPGDPESLLSPKVESFLLDRTGILWIGTHAEGLNYWDSRSKRLKAFRTDPADPEQRYFEQV